MHNNNQINYQITPVEDIEDFDENELPFADYYVYAAKTQQQQPETYDKNVSFMNQKIDHFYFQTNLHFWNTFYKNCGDHDWFDKNSAIIKVMTRKLLDNVL